MRRQAVGDGEGFPVRGSGRDAACQPVTGRSDDTGVGVGAGLTEELGVGFGEGEVEGDDEQLGDGVGTDTEMPSDPEFVAVLVAAGEVVSGAVGEAVGVGEQLWLGLP